MGGYLICSSIRRVSHLLIKYGAYILIRGTYVRVYYLLEVVVLINYKVYVARCTCYGLLKHWPIYFRRFGLIKRSDEVKHMRNGIYYSGGMV